MTEKSYEVGYQKPPKKNQFEKGKSGNPKGRPKGRKNKKEFFPSDTSNIYEFQKQIVDAGYEEIHVLKDGSPVSMSKIDAVLAQLYNKAMKGDLGASKLLLQYTQKSLVDLKTASDHVHKTTLKMRESERKKIFTPSPKPKSHGALLMYIHELYSARFAMREVFGNDALPQISSAEPKTEMDWPKFNRDMKRQYLEIGHEEAGIEIPDIPSLFTTIEN